MTLTCVWVGNPPLTLTWTKKDSNMVNLSLPVLNAGRKGHRHPGAVKTMGGVKLAFFQIKTGTFLGSWDLGENTCNQLYSFLNFA